MGHRSYFDTNEEIIAICEKWDKEDIQKLDAALWKDRDLRNTLAEAMPDHLKVAVRKPDIPKENQTPFVESLLAAARGVRRHPDNADSFNNTVEEMSESLIDVYKWVMRKKSETYSDEDYSRLKKLSAVCESENGLEQEFETMGISPPYIVVVDIESVWEDGHGSDKDRGKHYIFEIAFADLSGWTYSSLVRPTKPIIDNSTRKMYGLHLTKEREEDVINFPKTFPEVWDQLWAKIRERAGNNQVVLVCHNEEHDFPILRAEFSRNNMAAPIFRQSDSLPMCALFGFGSSARGKLIQKFSGKSQEGDHHALCDATSQVNLLYAFMGMMRFDHKTFGRYVFQKSKPFNPA